MNWALSGFRNIEHEAGAIITAAKDEAEEIATLVKTGVLSLIKRSKVLKKRSIPHPLRPTT